jgi:hypothetical protein
MFKRILSLLLGFKKKPAYALVPKQTRQMPQNRQTK